MIDAARTEHGLPGKRRSTAAGPTGVASTLRFTDADSGGQRRWLAVMFSDAVGSTELSRQLDLEDYGDVMLRYQNLCDEVVDRRGGHMAHYAGDGLLAVFGWPVSHERDADHAVLAALDLFAELPDLNEYLEDTHGVRLSLRIAIHSGLAVIGKLGRSGRDDTSVLGDVPNVASRLQHEAPVNSVVVSDATSRTLRDRWVLESLGHPELRGVGSEFEMLVVVGPQPAPGPDVGRVYELVDRHDALGELQEVWAQVVAGQGRVVALEGEAGVGKSRLAYELQHSGAVGAHWLTVQCSRLTSEEPFGPLVSHLPPADSWEGMSPEERHAAGIASAERWALGLCEDAPAVLHVEDVHWADPSTNALIERVAVALASSQRRLLVLCTTRPGADVGWLDRAEVRRIALGPLDDHDMAVLVGTATESPLPATTIAEIVQRADGLALYAEQLAATLVDAPTSQVPSTLQGILTARLDALGPEARQMLQWASAIGRVFDDDVLRRLMEANADLDSSLDRLVAADVLVRLPGGRHKFRHALLQDEAHASMMQGPRRAVHARIAAILREHYGVLVDAQPWLLARHLAEARDPQAVEWFERAGARAAAAGAFSEATLHFERALDAARRLGGSSEDELRLLIGLGNAIFGAQGWGAADTLPVWTRARELADELDAAEELTSALNGLATYWNQAGACRRSIEIAEQILHVADVHDLRVGRLRGHCTLALNYLFLGDSALSLEHARRAIALYEPEDFYTATYGYGTDQGVVAYSVAGAAAWFVGRPDEGLALAEKAVALGRRLASPISELLARVFKGLLHHLRGETEEARAEAAVLAEEGARLSLWLPLGFGHVLGGVQRAVTTADPTGMTDIEAGIDEVGKGGGQSGAPIAMVLLAEAHLATGDPGAAREVAQAGLAIADTLDQRFFDTELRRLEAMAAHALGHPVSESGALLRTAIDDGIARGQISLVLRAACDLAELNPQDLEAAGLVARLLSQFEDGDAVRDCARARDLLAT
jgi:class 3 adenylate cyclase/tetratricopeptide (TPR) repeat protein